MKPSEESHFQLFILLRSHPPCIVTVCVRHTHGSLTSSSSHFQAVAVPCCVPCCTVISTMLFVFLREDQREQRK